MIRIIAKGPFYECDQMVQNKSAERTLNAIRNFHKTTMDHLERRLGFVAFFDGVAFDKRYDKNHSDFNDEYKQFRKQNKLTVQITKL